MKRSSLTPKKANHQKLSTLDSVSASQLLKALHTLESINIIQEQIDDDLNISFSQKDTFSQDGNNDKNLVNMCNTIKNLPITQNHHQQQNRPSTTKNRTPKNHFKQTNNQFSALKNKNPQQPNDQNDSNTSKMNFQFYMSKKQHLLIGFNKKRSKSPRPSQAQQQQKMLNNKSFENTLNSTAKKSKENMTPRGKASNYGHNRTITQGEKQDNRHNYSVSPLTERVMNVNRGEDKFVRNKEARLKTETNERESNYYQKRHTKASSTLIHSNKEDQFNKTSISNQTAYKQSKPSKLPEPQQPTFIPTTTYKKPRPSAALHNLSILQRNKQYLRQKNQRLAKLCQQIQQKKRQQQKQCTFKPKLLNDNSNIKPKYNDLCVSRELTDKAHKKCKQGKQNANEQECVGEDEFYGSRGKCEVRFGKGGKSEYNNSKKSTTKDIHEESLNLEDEKPTVSIVKTKYKNSKFNILLDLIH